MILLHEIRDLWSITPFIWKKQNPFRVHSMRSFNPHIGSFHSPTWGYQKHNSYRVATPHSVFMMQYSANCKTIFRSFNPHISSFHSPTWGYQRHNSYRVAMLRSAFMIQYSTNCKTIFRSFNPHVGSFYSPTWGFQKHNSYRVAMFVIVIYSVK